MFKQISRMFGSKDPDTPEESDEEIDQAAPTDAEAPPNDSDEMDSGSEQAAAVADEGPDVHELDVRVAELDEELSSTDASLRELQNSQDEMANSIDEMSDRVRQLVGVYDRITAEENPFVDDPAEATPTDSGSPMASVEEGQSSDTVADGANGHDGGSEQPTTNGADEDVVSFDDLADDLDEPASPDLPPEDEFAHASDPEESPAAPPTPAPEAAHDDPEEPPTTPPTSAPEAAHDNDDGALLETIPDGYAGEVLVMEWLATLMERSGPAGAFRAVDYYENVDWISPTVEQRLVDVIGGPALDVFVDPTQPREPTADEHAVSHEYLRVMARMNEL